MGKAKQIVTIEGNSISEYELMLLFRKQYLEDKFGKLTEEDVKKTRENLKRLEQKADEAEEKIMTASKK